MPKNKIDKKWHSLIWILLILASFFRNIYPMYVMFGGETGGTAEVIVDVVYSVILDGLMPAVLCYLCASILFSITARRRIIFSSAADFIYIVMIATAAARFVMGFIEVFAILEPEVYSVTALILDVTVLSAALYIAYFTVLAPKFMNGYTAFAAYSVYMPIYLIMQGINTLMPAISVFIVKNVKSPELAELFEQYGLSLNVTEAMFAGAIAAIVIYAVLVIVSIVLNELLRKKAKSYVPPQAPPPPPPAQDVNPFEFDLGSYGGTDDKKDNVFDEFDI